MKILTITADYPPFFVGGTTVHTHKLSTSLAKLNFEPWVVTFHADPKNSSIEASREDDVQIVRVPRPESVSEEYAIQYLLQNHCVKKGLIHLFEKYPLDYDLVILQGYFLADAALYAKAILNVPLVYHSHALFQYDENDECSRTNQILGNVRKALLSSSDRIIAVSEYLKKVIVDSDPDTDSKIEVINKGIEFKEYDKCAAPARMSYRRIQYVGRLSPEKGLDVLIKAYSRIRAKIEPDSVLSIAGTFSNQSYQKYIRTLIRNLGLEKNVMFQGHVEPEDVVAVYKSSDLIVVPSYMETFGRVAIEAMASRVPVIVSDVGGLGPIIKDNVNGLKFESGNDADLARKMHAILEHPSLASDLTKAAYRTVRKYYSWNEILDQTIDAYSRTAKER